jgi:NAD+ kinase
MPTVRRVGLVPHPERELARELLGAAVTWFGAREIEVRIPESIASRVGYPALGVGDDVFGTGLDLVISLGGDGTMLHAVALARAAGVAVLGVNVGQLGYLTNLEPTDFADALPRLVAGEGRVSERTMLECVVEPENGSSRVLHGLNELVLEKVHAGRLIRLDVVISGSPFTTYAADGVIVATPTGSTAYSFSARGPIVSPRNRCLVLTPVSPHMLFDRALVLAPDEELAMTVVEPPHAGGPRAPVALTVDGREYGQLGPGDRVTCRVGAQPARLMELRARDFHQILKAKFALPDR